MDRGGLKQLPTNDEMRVNDHPIALCNYTEKLPGAIVLIGAISATKTEKGHRFLPGHQALKEILTLHSLRTVTLVRDTSPILKRNQRSGNMNWICWTLQWQRMRRIPLHTYLQVPVNTLPLCPMTRTFR
jgi:hypothetical protein